MVVVSRRLTMVPTAFTANATQTIVMPMSIGHSSSAYSLLVVTERQRQRGGDNDELPAPKV